MSRHERQSHPYAFAREGDFNEQLYLALRQSPWWLVSILVHVVVVGAFVLLDTSELAAEPEALLTTSHADTFEEEIPDVDEETEKIKEQDVTAEQPVIMPEELQDHAETDNDLEHDEVYGESDGISDAPFEGPSTNSDIGVGGGAGGAFKGRGGKRNSRSGGGGNTKFDDAVDWALRWLAAHQSPNGGWEAANFMHWCDGKRVDDPSKRPDGAGKGLYDAGVSGMAMCAFLGAGYTNRGTHEFTRVVARGLGYLKNIQDPEGCFGPRSTQQYIYNHATCALAMVEAYGMTGSPMFKHSAQKALDFIALSRNPYFAWRYGIKPGDNDSSVTGWMMMALKSASLVNADAAKRGKPMPLQVDESAFDGIRAWLQKVTDPDTGKVGYLTRGSGSARPHELLDRFPADKSEAMTAVGMLARTFIGEDPAKSAVIQKGAALCAKLPPTWNETDGSIDMYYWYYATLAMYQVGGRHWDKWKAAMQTAMVETQRKDTDFCQYKGSWDPAGPWGGDGGRVYSTACMALCLEVLHRYDRVFTGGR